MPTFVQSDPARLCCKNCPKMQRHEVAEAFYSCSVLGFNTGILVSLQPLDQVGQYNFGAHMQLALHAYACLDRLAEQQHVATNSVRT